MFAITAVTGKVGGAAARALIDRQQTIRAIMRDAARSTAWAERGCEIVEAASDDAHALARAFEGAEGVFLLLPPNFDPSPDFAESRGIITAFREALRAARPAKVVVLSTIGADAPQPNLLNALRLLEEGLADVDLPITFLRAAWFMENAAWDVASAREGTIHSFLQPAERAIAMISAEEVGTTVADLLLEDWSGHRVVELEAKTRISPLDIAAAFGRALGHHVAVQTVPRPTWEALFYAQGMRNPLPRMQMIDGFNEGWIDFKGENPDRRFGRVELDEVIEGLVGKA